MEDIRNLLRYEIPGLLSIVYFLMLSYRISSILVREISSDMIGLSALAVIAALPIGVLIYNLYISCEYRSFMGNRIGIRCIIPTILKRTSLYRERQWWEFPGRTIEEKYEILDTGFYHDPGDTGGMKDLLERFLNYYHSGRVIGLYVPLVASFFAFILSLRCQLCLDFFDALQDAHSSCYSLVDSLLVFAYCILVIKSKHFNSYLLKKREKLGLPLYLLSALAFAFLYILGSILIFSLLIIFISCFILHKNNSLWNQIKELETNLLLEKEEDMVRAIRRRIQYGV